MRILAYLATGDGGGRGVVGVVGIKEDEAELARFDLHIVQCQALGQLIAEGGDNNVNAFRLAFLIIFKQSILPLFIIIGVALIYNRYFKPNIKEENREKLYKGWNEAIMRSLMWKKSIT